MAEPSQVLRPGQKFGRYEVVRRIGVGGMAEVYEANFPALRKRVAIKVLNARASERPDAVRRFLREGEAAARIRHPHVVEVFDLGTEGGITFLGMELLDGEDLGSLLERERQLPIERVADILIPVSAGVAAAHDEGIVHRDLKPENVFLARSREGTSEPKIVDFGISKLDDPTSPALGMTATAAFLGTPYYVSPEQARGAKDTTARSDQYSLAVIAYECVTGRRPFEGETFLALMHSIVRGVYAPPSTLRPDMPRELEAVIQRAMAMMPEQRYESVRGFARALLPFASAPVRAYWEPRLSETLSAQVRLPAHTPAQTPRLEPETFDTGPLQTGAASSDAQGLPGTYAATQVGTIGPPPRVRSPSTLGSSVRELPAASGGPRIGLLFGLLAAAAIVAGAITLSVLVATSSGDRAATSGLRSTTAATPVAPSSRPAAPAEPAPSTTVSAPTTIATPAITRTAAPVPPAVPLAAPSAATAPAIAPTAPPAGTPTPSVGTAEPTDRTPARGTTRRTPSTPRVRSTRLGTRGAPIVPR